MYIKVSKLTFFVCVLFSIVGCFGGGKKNQPAPQTPMIDAGSVIVATEFESVQLIPSISDPDRQLASYSWEQLSGPSVEVTVSGKNGSFEVPYIDKDTTALFQFTATSITGAFYTDTVEANLLGSYSLHTSDLGALNVITASESIEIQLETADEVIESNYAIKNDDGTEVTLTVVENDLLNLMANGAGNFSLWVQNKTAFRAEEVEYAFEVEEPWIQSIAESTQHLPGYQRVKNELTIQTTITVPEQYDVQWSLDNTLISTADSLDHTINKTGKSTLALTVLDGAETKYENSWIIDVYKSIRNPNTVVSHNTIEVAEYDLSTIKGLKIELPVDSAYRADEIDIFELNNGENKTSFALKPNGASFPEGVTISLPYSSESIWDNVYVVHRDELDNYTDEIETIINDGTVQFTTTRFSSFDVLSGPGSINEISELSDHNLSFSEDLADAYTLFEKVYSDINKTYLALNVGAQAADQMTVSKALERAYRMLSNIDLLEQKLRFQAMSSVLDNVKRDPSYWKTKGRPANYGSAQHTAMLQKLNDLKLIITDYRKSLDAISDKTKIISSLTSSVLTPIIDGFGRVDIVLTPLFVLIDSSLAIYKAVNGDGWAASKSGFNASAGVLSLYASGVRVGAVSKFKIVLTKGPKNPAALAALTGAAVIDSFILDPLVYKPSSDFELYISDTALPELHRLVDATRQSFQYVMDYAKNGNTDEHLDEFTDINGLIEQFKIIRMGAKQKAQELYSQVTEQYESIWVKTDSVHLPYIAFNDGYSGFFDALDWQLERLEREKQKAATNISRIELARDEAIKKMESLSELPFSIESASAQINSDVIEFTINTSGVTENIEIKVESDGVYNAIAQLSHTSNELLYKVPVSEFVERFGRSNEYQIVVSSQSDAEEEMYEFTFTVGQEFWSAFNTPAEFYIDPILKLSIYDLLKDSVTFDIVEGSRGLHEHSPIKIAFSVELDNYRAIDEDGDFLHIDTGTYFRDEIWKVGMSLDNPCALGNGQYETYKDSLNCKGDTLGYLPVLSFNSTTSANNNSVSPSMCQHNTIFEQEHWGFDEGFPLILREISFYPLVLYNVINSSEYTSKVELDREYPFPVSVLDSGEITLSKQNAPYDSFIFITANLDGLEGLEEGNYAVTTILMSGCNSTAESEFFTLDQLKTNPIKFSARYHASYADIVSDYGAKIIKLLLKYEGDSTEIMGYGIQDIPASSFRD